MRSAIVIVLLTIAFIPGAGAESLVQEFTFNGITEYTRTFTFNKFNMPGYTLTAVKITEGVNNVGGTVVLDNDNPHAVEGAAIAVPGVENQSDDVRLAYTASWLRSFQEGNPYHLSPDNGDGPGNLDPTGPDGKYYSLPGYSLWGYLNMTYVSDYVGADTFRINTSVSQQLSLTDPTGIEIGMLQVNTEGSTALEYVYEAVPEPSGGLAFLAGVSSLIGLATQIRRRPVHA